MSGSITINCYHEPDSGFRVYLYPQGLGGMTSGNDVETFAADTPEEMYEKLDPFVQAIWGSRVDALAKRRKGLIEDLAKTEKALG